MMMKTFLKLSVLAFCVSSAFCASVFQLDVCNKHRSVSEAPGTSLTIMKDGMCVVTSQVLSATGASCTATRSSTAVLLRFPCKEEPRLKQATGPALNVWGSFEGIPQPTKSGMIVNEAGVLQRHSMHAALQGYVVNGTAAAVSNTAVAAKAMQTKGSCSFLTVNPGIYYHKTPPMLTYGYAVSGLPCERAASALAATQSLQEPGSRTFPTTYSIWLKPSLPAPPISMSSEQQSCNLVISVLSHSYVSTDTYPCSMRTLDPATLQEGCCYNAGGFGRRLLGWSGRQLLSSWEKAMSYRRALQM